MSIMLKAIFYAISKLMNTKKIATTLEEIATLLELQGQNPFRIRAYRNASRIISNTKIGLENLIEEIQQGKIKGIGEHLSELILELYETGELVFLENLRSEFPEGLLKLLDIQGLGAKKVKILYEKLDITNIDELEDACQNDELAQLQGFGKKTQDNILSGIERLKKFSSRFLFSEAYTEALAIIEYLKDLNNIQKIEIAGSLRRCKETVKDIDIIASSRSAKKLMSTFVDYPQVERVTNHGETKSSIILKNALSVDLRVVSAKEFSAALMHFTGSKEHNTFLRKIAKSKNYKLNEYGLFKGEKAFDLKSEKDLHRKLGLSYIPPEVREDNGEIDYAQKLFEEKKEFPKLIELRDIKGILHAHSTYSDGVDTLEELAKAIKDMGYQYLGITDHSQSAAYAGGLKKENIKRQHAQIDRLNQELAPFKIFKGIESDILADGSLDYPDKILEKFDFIIASIHSRFSMTKKQMTKRIITAIENPYTNILGHCSGRLLLQRDAYELDTIAVLEAAAEHNVAVELNANPKRLDIDWRYLNKARELKIPIPINPDAHSIQGVYNTVFGVGVARKGWLTKKDVLNTKTTKQLEKYFNLKK